MNFNSYQTEVAKTAIYPKYEGWSWVYPVLGLSNEAGEVLGKLKKILRDKGGVVTSKDVNDIEAELGDVLWYVAQVATEFDISLYDIAETNLDKLHDRLDRGVIQGSGDNR